MDDRSRLNRFLAPQADSYATALSELRPGRKRSHWIWFVFPQLKGLGRSANAAFYGLSGLPEARAFLADAVLGERLREAVRAALEHDTLSASDIFDDVDAMKFRSCLTLFSRAAPDEPLFTTALSRFFSGQADPLTLALLDEAGQHDTPDSRG